jgi:hypothetical protein
MKMKLCQKRWMPISVVLLVTLLLGGCYWTPQGAEGAITLEIDSGQIGTSQTEPFDGIFLGYVIADDLMRGDTVAAEGALTEIEQAQTEAFNKFSQTGNAEDLNVNVSFPSIQLQLNVFNGTSGSNTFAGLRAGREYLVVVTAASSDAEGIGFTTATVEAGENKRVNLDLANNFNAFDQFLADRYGILQPGAIEIQDGDGYYIDLVAGATAPNFPTDFETQQYENWYSATTLLNPNGEPIEKSGSRTAITGFVFLIEGVTTERSWRLMITTSPDRGTIPETLYVSEEFTVAPGQTKTFDFASGDSPQGFTDYYWFGS